MHREYNTKCVSLFDDTHIDELISSIYTRKGEHIYQWKDIQKYYVHICDTKEMTWIMAHGMT